MQVLFKKDIGEEIADHGYRDGQEDPEPLVGPNQVVKAFFQGIGI